MFSKLAPGIMAKPTGLVVTKVLNKISVRPEQLQMEIMSLIGKVDIIMILMLYQVMLCWTILTILGTSHFHSRRAREIPPRAAVLGVSKAREIPPKAAVLGVSKI